MRPSHVLAVAVLAALAAVAVGCGGTAPGGDAAAPPPTSTPTAAGSDTPRPDRPPPASSSAPAPAPARPEGPGRPAGYLPLWPFGTAAEAELWQRSHRAGGHQPWHTSAEQTALSFTAGYLGFAGVDRVTSQVIRGDDALVAVGYAATGGRRSTAAVIHLIRYGRGPDAPWEVVGTRDTTLRLTSPSYAATVSSPVRVGGRITGVDENIHVWIRQASAGRPLGETCCLPAGGTNTPWSTTVRLRYATGPVLTIVAATGGHLTGVDRFAVTGVRLSGSYQATYGTGRTARDGDIDGDGRTDQVSLAAPGLLHVRYFAGGSDDARFDGAAGPPGQRLLGVVDVDRDGHAEVFLRATSGASTQFAALFRYTNGHLHLVMSEGRQAQLGYGGTVTRLDSWACRQPAAPIVAWTGTSSDGRTYQGTEFLYQFFGTELTVMGTRPHTYTSAAPAPSGCGSLVLQ
jgi:hypothetical protein